MSETASHSPNWTRRSDAAAHHGAREIADTVVIGGGVIGCSIAYHLAREGVRVTLLEAREVASAASGASAGGVRQQGRDPRELPLALRAIDRWPTLGDELGANLDYHQSGHLTLAETDAEMAMLSSAVARQQAGGLAIEMVDAAAVRELAPGVGPTVRGGSYCARDGHAFPIWTTEAFAAAALRHGASLRERTPVESLLTARGRITGVRISTGTLHAGAVIAATGAWTAQLMTTTGINVPMHPIGLQMMVTPPAPPALTPVLGCVGRQLSLKQLAGGQYLIGGGWPGSVDLVAAHSANRARSMHGSAIAASAIWPALRRLPVVRAWSGLESESADGVPILDRVGTVDGLYIASGFCGHGFALSPAVGEAMAGLVLRGAAEVDISGLRLTRFNA